MVHAATAIWALLRCPECQNEITNKGQTLHCGRCGTEWPVIDGVPYFVTEAPYWGEPGMTQEVTRQILAEMESKSWHEVMKAHSSAQVRQRYESLSDMTRADWRKLLALDATSNVLDLGAGLGTISRALSQHCGHVFAVEQVEERVHFMRKRFQQDGCNNITVLRGSANTLPFAANSFDLIVLNGVLEWLPLSKKATNPRAAQLHYLRALRNLLKPGGTLYVGVENRFDYNLLLGGPDPHLYIRYVAILPRWIADVVCRIKIKDRYRPYIYSQIGYRRLFSEAGYGSCEIFAVYPSYHQPRKMLNLKGRSEEFVDYVWLTKNVFSLWAKRILVRLDLLKNFCSAFVILGQK